MRASWSRWRRPSTTTDVTCSCYAPAPTPIRPVFFLEATVRREVMEETGVDIEPSSPVYLHSKTFSLSEDRPVVDAVFLCRYRAGDARPDGVEIEEALWLTPAELATRDDAAGWLRRSVALCEAKREELGWD